MARRSPANDKGTLLGIPAPVVFDEPPPRAPVTVEAGAASNEPSVSEPANEVTEHTGAEGERTDSNGYDPYRFGATKFPPGLRSELIQTKLPRVDPEELKDTVPPNAGIEAFIARPSKRARLLGTGALVLLAIGGPLAWVVLAGREDRMPTAASARNAAVAPSATPSAPQRTKPAPTLTAARAIAVGSPPSDPPSEEVPNPPEVVSTRRPSTRAVNAASVRTAAAVVKVEPSPPARPALSSTASNTDLFDLPIGPKPR
jgi:hypothetical protein